MDAVTAGVCMCAGGADLNGLSAAFKVLLSLSVRQIMDAASLSLCSGGHTGGMTEEKCPQLVDYFVVAGLDPAGPWTSLDEDGKTSAAVSSCLSVTDVAVIARGLGEEVPEGFTCIERTLGGHSAELSVGLINNPHLYLCYRRGRDKPPILDLG